MIYFADTHAVYWALNGNEKRLGHRAAQVFRNVERGRAHITISVLSLFELTLLSEKARLPMSAMDLFRSAVSKSPNYSIADLTEAAVRSAEGIPQLRDPLDRLIAAHALSLDYPLLTKDEEFARIPGLETIWD